jgi:hypothetical protein
VITLDREAIEAIQAEGTLPPRATCTPLTADGSRALPSRTTRTSGRMEWTWRTITRRVHVTQLLIRLGDHAQTFDADPHTRLEPGDALTVIAALPNLRI